MCGAFVRLVEEQLSFNQQDGKKRVIGQYFSDLVLGVLVNASLLVA